MHQQLVMTKPQSHQQKKKRIYSLNGIDMRGLHKIFDNIKNRIIMMWESAHLNNFLNQELPSFTFLISLIFYATGIKTIFNEHKPIF